METPKSANTIEELSQEMIAYKSEESNRYEEIIEHLQTCCLCGGELTYHHETDYIMLTVREEANCHACGISTKRESHPIQ